MAIIYGIELKGITKFKGHEGEPLIQGNIYFNGKKVGLYSDDSWGGEEIIHINSDVRDQIKLMATKYIELNPPPFEFLKSNPIGYLFGDLVFLIGLESEWKRAKKKGYEAMVCANDNFKKKSPKVPMVTYCVKEIVHEVEKDYLAKGYDSVKSYADANDFIINI